MSIINTLRKGVALAHGVLGSCEGTVVHEAWIGDDGYGKDSFDTPVGRPCIIEYENKQIYDKDGNLAVLKATLQFLVPLTANGAANRAEPIDPRDIFTLPNGSKGSILSTGGFVDPGTGLPLAPSVQIGDKIGQTAQQ